MEPDRQDEGDIIQFGGLPVRWPFPAIRVTASRTSVAIALSMLAAGLVIGFFAGGLTAHQPARKHRSHMMVATPSIIQQFATTALGLTGARCGVQVGNDLQVGVEIMNETPSSIGLDRITTIFPLGGLRTISVRVGRCGAHARNGTVPSASLAPDATEWIVATIAVRVPCPQPLPVWFKIDYTSAGQIGNSVLDGFPDLGSVSYRRCGEFGGSNAATGAVVFIVGGNGRRPPLHP